MRRNGDIIRKNGATPARKTILVAFLAFLLFAFARYCVSRVALQKVLAESAVARASARFSTDAPASPARVEPARKASVPRSRVERDLFLRAAAERWQARRSDAATEVVARGLARWGVERRVPGACAPEAGEGGAFSYAAERWATRDEARASANALETTRRADADPDLDAALAFLSEFEAGDLPEDRADVFLWSFGGAGSPDAALGLVSERDFDFDARALAAKRLACASSNLFFALTGGVFALVCFAGRAFDAIRFAKFVATFLAGRRGALDAETPLRRRQGSGRRLFAPQSALFLSERLLI